MTDAQDIDSTSVARVAKLYVLLKKEFCDFPTFTYNTLTRLVDANYETVRAALEQISSTDLENFRDLAHQELVVTGFRPFPSGFLIDFNNEDEVSKKKDLLQPKWERLMSHINRVAAK